MFFYVANDLSCTGHRGLILRRNLPQFKPDVLGYVYILRSRVFFSIPRNPSAPPFAPTVSCTETQTKNDDGTYLSQRHGFNPPPHPLVGFAQRMTNKSKLFLSLFPLGWISILQRFHPTTSSHDYYFCFVLYYFQLYRVVFRNSFRVVFKMGFFLRSFDHLEKRQKNVEFVAKKRKKTN